MRTLETIPTGDVEYVYRTPTEIPEGRVLVHDSVRPPQESARVASGDATGQRFSRGFRAWLEPPDDDKLEICDCGWAARLGSHYRMRPLNLDIAKRAWDRP